MLRAVLSVSYTFWAVSERKLRVWNLGSATDTALVMCNAAAWPRLWKLCLILLLSRFLLDILLKRQPVLAGINKYSKVNKCNHNRCAVWDSHSHAKTEESVNIHCKHHKIDYYQPFHFYRKDKIQPYLCVWHQKSKHQVHCYKQIVNWQTDRNLCHQVNNHS